LRLIIELATYEKEASSVEATPDKLLSTISFAPGPSSPREGEPDISSARPARCLMITPLNSSTPVGLALYFHNYSTWRAAPGIYLEDLYVQPDQRGKGYGKALLQALAKEVVAIKGGRLEWSVLKWNEPSIKFYESQAIGAKGMTEWLGMRVDGEGLIKLANSGSDAAKGPV
jgi:GNAT superfamily N-acetyltransferase